MPLKMSPGILVKYLRSLAAAPLNRRWLAGLGGEQCLVLTYHRVLPRDEVDSWLEPGIYVTPGTLRCHIRFIIKYCDIVAVDRLGKKEAGHRKNRKPLCILTFDDGWLDFYTHAWPVLRKENVPSVVYLPTGLIGRNDIFWTDRLARLLEQKSGRAILGEQAKQIALPGGEVLGSSGLGKAIEHIKGYPWYQIDELLSSCEHKAGVSATRGSRSFMSWEEVS